MLFCEPGCDGDHCCAKGRCCIHYYEMWYFWLTWIILALVGICCFYHHRRMKNLEQQAHSSVRYDSNLNSVTTSVSHLGPKAHLQCTAADSLFHLPRYEELPNKPPPYAEIISDNQKMLIPTVDNTECHQGTSSFAVMVTSYDDLIIEPPPTGAPPTYSSENLASIVTDTDTVEVSISPSQSSVYNEATSHESLLQSTEETLPN